MNNEIRRGKNENEGGETGVKRYNLGKLLIPTKKVLGIIIRLKVLGRKIGSARFRRYQLFKNQLDHSPMAVFKRLGGSQSAVSPQVLEAATSGHSAGRPWNFLWLAAGRVCHWAVPQSPNLLHAFFHLHCVHHWSRCSIPYTFRHFFVSPRTRRVGLLGSLEAGAENDSFRCLTGDA